MSTCHPLTAGFLFQNVIKFCPQTILLPPINEYPFYSLPRGLINPETYFEDMFTNLEKQTTLKPEDILVLLDPCNQDTMPQILNESASCFESPFCTSAFYFIARVKHPSSHGSALNWVPIKGVFEFPDFPEQRKGLLHEAWARVTHNLDESNWICGKDLLDSWKQSSQDQEKQPTKEEEVEKEKEKEAFQLDAHEWPTLMVSSPFPSSPASESEPSTTSKPF